VPIRARGAAHGTAPIPVWSGCTVRHRLNRVGDRQLNVALHRIAITSSSARVPAAPTSRSGWLPATRRPRPSGPSAVASATNSSGACRPTGPSSLIWTLMDPVSFVSCVSSWYWVSAAETHQTFHRESGMRYQVSSSPDLSTNRCLLVPGCILIRTFIARERAHLVVRARATRPSALMAPPLLAKR
jgi:hypothetical protein